MSGGGSRASVARAVALLAGAAVALLVAGCASSSSSAAAPGAAGGSRSPPAAFDAAMGAARAGFRLLPPEDAALAAAVDVVPLLRFALHPGSGIDDYPESELVGRLRTLFGAVPDDRYVLEHRATGYLIVAEGVPVARYFGGRRVNSELEHAAEARWRSARTAADPLLAQGEPPLAGSAGTPTVAELDAWGTAMRAYMLRRAQVAMPPGWFEAVSELDKLVSAAPLSDWEGLRFDGEEVELWTVGVDDGKPFTSSVLPVTALKLLLEDDERDGSAVRDWDPGWTLPAIRALLYWRGKPVSRDPALQARAQKTWHRAVAQVRAFADAAEDRETFEWTVDFLEQVGPELGIDPEVVDKSLR